MSTNKKKLQHRRVQWFGGTMLAVLGLGAILTVVGMSSSVHQIHENLISKTPDVVLASAGVSEEKGVSLPVAYYDQRADACVNLYDESQKIALEERQFEWAKCGYYNKGLEQGLMEYELGNDYALIAKGEGEALPNRGISDIKRWFNSSDGKSQSYTGNLKLEYDANGAVFTYDNEDFYPLDDVKFSEGDFVNTDGHNHLFTMNYAVPFTVLASGDESFEIIADDDTFVYVDTRLAIDLGGIHDAMNGKLVINHDGEVYTSVNDEELAYSGINVEKGQNAILRIYHADRDSDDSVLKVQITGMSLNIVDATFAGADEGVQIAYDPTDPSYMPPLGQSVIVRPDSTRGYIIMATIEGVAIVVIAVFAVVMARALIKNRK